MDQQHGKSEKDSEQKQELQQVHQAAHADLLALKACETAAALAATALRRSTGGVICRDCKKIRLLGNTDIVAV